MHRHPDFTGLTDQVVEQAWQYLVAIGFDQTKLALHVQRCWPVLSDWDQVVGRHHHPNAHLGAVVYLSESGSGDAGVLRINAPAQPNELVPGPAAGHGGPIAPGHRFNQPHWDLAPQPGLLVLFHSRLDHSVLANGDPELLRCSISFDFVLTAPAEGDPPEYLAPHPSVWTPQPLKAN